MRRVYLKEALEARPIIKRLTENLSATANFVAELVKKPSDDTTVIQIRQQLDELDEDTKKLRNRLAAAERELQLTE